MLQLRSWCYCVTVVVFVLLCYSCGLGVVVLQLRSWCYCVTVEVLVLLCYS